MLKCNARKITASQPMTGSERERGVVVVVCDSG